MQYKVILGNRTKRGVTLNNIKELINYISDVNPALSVRIRYPIWKCTNCQGINFTDKDKCGLCGNTRRIHGIDLDELL